LENVDDLRFSIAASFPSDVSGLMIRNIGEADVICDQRRCNIYHGWVEIPQTFDRDHRMADGESFVIYLGPPQETSSDAAENLPSNDAVLNDDHDYDDSPAGQSAPQAEELAVNHWISHRIRWKTSCSLKISRDTAPKRSNVNSQAILPPPSNSSGSGQMGTF
jgi:hypothetical protein